MSLAQEMWTYLKSIGFEDIPNNDDRLGAQGAPDAIHWEHTIARDNLCAFCNEPTGSYIFLSDLNNYNLRMPVRTNDINIHSVSDLERWLRKEYPEFFITKKPTKVSINTSLSDKVSPLEWAFNKSKTILGIYNSPKEAQQAAEAWYRWSLLSCFDGQPKGELK